MVGKKRVLKPTTLFCQLARKFIANFLGKAEILSEKSRIGTQCFAKS